MSAPLENPLALQIREAKISESESAVLETVFVPFFEQAERWKDKALAIQVTTPDDKKGMSEAREVRLALKSIRVDVEKRRKEMKEESLRKGKAIDLVANIIKSVIEPLEEHLEKQENFVKQQEQKRLAERKEARIRELSQLGINPEYYDLVAMPEDTYAKLVEDAKYGFEMAKESERKAQEERVAREKADAEERERMRIENERLKKEAQEREKEKQRLEAEAKAKKDAEEADRKREEEQRRQAQLAPDKEKLVALADRISKVELPELASEEAKVVLKHTIDLLGKVSQYLKTQSINL